MFKLGLLWPKPTGNTDLGRFLSKININNIEIQIMKRGRSNDLMSAAGQVGFAMIIAYMYNNIVMTFLCLKKKRKMI